MASTLVQISSWTGTSGLEWQPTGPWPGLPAPPWPCGHPASETHRFEIGTQDLEEIERIQSLLMKRFESRGNRVHSEKAARRRLARAYLNRTHDCLHRGRDRHRPSLLWTEPSLLIAGSGRRSPSTLSWPSRLPHWSSPLRMDEPLVSPATIRPISESE